MDGRPTPRTRETPHAPQAAHPHPSSSRPRRSRTAALAATAAATVLATAAGTLTGPASAVAPATPRDPSPSERASGLTTSPELSTTSRLADRRSLVTGDRFWSMGTEDGTYPATGFHTRGEMGGFWTPPIKLLDGLWFKAGDTWLTADRYTSGWGYSRMDLGTHDGVAITRTDVAPDGLRAGLVGLRLDSPTATTLRLAVDAHSELMKAYPWGETTPSQTTYNLPDTGAVAGKDLVFTEQGTPPVANAERHDYAAVVGSTLTPSGTELGPDHRGPQGDVVCPASGPGTATPPARCDDTAYGKGTAAAAVLRQRPRRRAHDLVRRRRVRPRRGRRPAAAGRRPGRPGRAAAAQGRRPAGRRRRDPGEPARRPAAGALDHLEQAEPRRLGAGVARPPGPGDQRRDGVPPAAGSVAKARWYGAGFPDYPWLFATDGEYTGFAAVASGQFSSIEAHLRALRDVSLVANGRSGKVVHEVTPDGQVYFGATTDDGNTDETAKFPSLVALVWRWTGDDRFRDEMYSFARSNLRYVYAALDTDGDGWPEGLGNVERAGMGEEKLDNTVYTIRGLRDLADLAASKGDRATRRWATTRPSGSSGASRRRGGTAPAASSTPTRSTTRQRAGLPAPLDRRHPRRGRAAPTGSSRRPARLARPRRRAPGEAGGALLHRHLRPLPHRHRRHHRRGRQQGRHVRQRRLQRAVRAVGVHAELLDHGRGRVGPGSYGRRPGGSLHDRQRPHPARPVGVGAARLDAGDRALAGLRRQHRQVAARALDGGPGVGHLRRAVAGGALPARRLARPGAQPLERRPQVPQGQTRVSGSAIHLGSRPPGRSTSASARAPVASCAPR